MERIQQVYVLAGDDCKEITDEAEKVPILRESKWGTDAPWGNPIQGNTRNSGLTGGGGSEPRAMGHAEQGVEQDSFPVEEKIPTSVRTGATFTFNPAAKAFIPAETAFDFNPRAKEFRPTTANIHKIQSDTGEYTAESGR